MKNRKIIRSGTIGLFLALVLSACAKQDTVIRTYTTEAETVEGTSQSGQTGKEKDTSQSGSTDEKEECIVYVCGAVKKEGVYRLEEGKRVADAVEMAGGFTKQARTDAVNLARPLKDGEQIYIPKQGEAGREEPGPEESYSAQEEDDRVNINTADAALLMTLPGIGESKAADILAFREKNGGFTKPDDLMKVPGIKEGTYKKIENRIRTD